MSNYYIGSMSFDSNYLQHYGRPGMRKGQHLPDIQNPDAALAGGPSRGHVGNQSPDVHLRNEIADQKNVNITNYIKGKGKKTSHRTIVNPRPNSNAEVNAQIDRSLATLASPSHQAPTYGTRRNGNRMSNAELGKLRENAVYDGPTIVDGGHGKIKKKKS